MSLLAADGSMSSTGALVLMVGVGSLLVGSGWLVVEIARRGADGRLTPNGWAGIRTGATRSSDEAWRVAHETARGLTVRGGQVLIATGVLGTPLALASGRGDVDRALATWGVITLVGAATVTALVVAGAVRGHRAAVAVRDASVSPLR